MENTNKERKFDNFDEYAKDYRTIHNENIQISGESSEYFAEFKIKWLQKNIKETHFTFLDFGCGDGTLADWFVKYFPNAQYFGIDISDESIKIAQLKNLKNTEFHTFDGIKIPFPDQYFNYSIAACVFHHIDHSLHPQVLDEIKRVLKPNGSFFLWEHNPLNPITRKVVSECIFDKDCVLLKPSYSETIVRSAKFNNYKSDFVIFMPRKSIFKPFLFMENWFKKIPIGAQYILTAIK